MVEDRDGGQAWTEGPQMFTSTNASSAPPAGYKLLDLKLKTVAAQSTVLVFSLYQLFSFFCKINVKEVETFVLQKEENN